MGVPLTLVSLTLVPFTLVPPAPTVTPVLTLGRRPNSSTVGATDGRRDPDGWRVTFSRSFSRREAVERRKPKPRIERRPADVEAESGTGGGGGGGAVSDDALEAELLRAKNGMPVGVLRGLGLPSASDMPLLMLLVRDMSCGCGKRD